MTTPEPTPSVDMACPKCGATHSPELTRLHEAFGGGGKIWQCGSREREGEQAPGCRIRELESQLTRQLVATREAEKKAARWQWRFSDKLIGDEACHDWVELFAAVVKLQNRAEAAEAARDSLAAKLREVLVDISGYVATDEYNEERMAVGIPTAVLKSWIKALTTEPAAEAEGGRG